MRDRRQTLADRPARSGAIAERFWSTFAAQPWECVAFYLETRTEVTTASLIAGARARSIRIVVPYCLGDELRFVETQSDDDVELGMFGVREPKQSRRATHGVVIAEIDAMVVPGLAFDRRGYRLGYGRGYYDRALRERRADAIAIGVAFDCQLTEHVPGEPHDVPVDWIVTESQSICCEAQQSNLQ
jgi:5-formyltetrahydrofolate cyclo-ligase